MNILKDYVDFFVICESEETHRGDKKKLNFPLEKFQDIKEKIIYLKFEKFPKFKSTWDRQNYQRNYLINGLVKANDDGFKAEELWIVNLAEKDHDCRLPRGVV